MHAVHDTTRQLLEFVMKKLQKVKTATLKLTDFIIIIFFALW